MLVGRSGSIARGTSPSEVQRRFPVGGRILEACGAESQARNSSLKFGPGKTPELKVKGLKCRIASGPLCDHFGITLGSLRLHASICMPNVRSKLRLLFNVRCLMLDIQIYEIVSTKTKKGVNRPRVAAPGFFLK